MDAKIFVPFNKRIKRTINLSLEGYVRPVIVYYGFTNDRKPDNDSTAITSGLDKGKAYKVPIAHAEGRYFADEDTLKTLRQNRQILFRYCDENGIITAEANPNGTIDNIAGICNEQQNVFGMMPHPERAADDELGNTDGRQIFESILKNFS